MCERPGEGRAGEGAGGARDKGVKAGRDGEGEWFDLRELDQGVVRDTTDGKSWLQPVNRGDQPPSRAGKRYDAEWEGDGWYELSLIHI